MPPVAGDNVCETWSFRTRHNPSYINSFYTTNQDPLKFDLDNVRVAKLPGAGLEKSFVVDGMCVVHDVLTTCKKKTKSKVAVYSQGVESATTETKSTVLLESAKQLLDFSKGEESQMHDFVEKLANAGVDVIISGGAVSDLALHYLNKFGMLCLKIQSKFELRRICRTLGATAVIGMREPTPEEMGFADAVEIREIASSKVTILKSVASRVATFVIRGSTPGVLAELERVVDNAANVVRCSARSNAFVAGGGACEAELSMRVCEWAETLPGLEQYAAGKFGEALKAVPKLLSDNAGYNRIDTMAALDAAHQDGVKGKFIGLDCFQPTGSTALRDSLEAQVLDHLETKAWAIRLATDAVLTVLRVDQIIMAKQAGGPKPQ